MSDQPNDHDDKPMIPDDLVPRQLSDDPVAGDPDATAPSKQSEDASDIEETG